MIPNYYEFQNTSSGRAIKIYVSVIQREVINVRLIYGFPLVTINSLNNEFFPTINISNQFSEMKVTEFVSGLVKLFNLVITSDDGIIFNFTPLQVWQNQGNTYDITNYVIRDEYQVLRPTIYNEINFKFTESSTVLYEQFKTFFGYNWGDSYFKVEDENGKQVEGEQYTIEVPFQQSVYERFVDSYTGELQDLVWSEGKGLENHLFFAIKRSNRFNPSKINKITSQNQIMLAFDSEIEEYTRVENYNSLFLLFYNDYISDIFSVRRKSEEIEAILPNYLITNLQLNDKLIIDFNYFLIDELTVDLTSGKTKLKLSNDV